MVISTGWKTNMYFEVLTAFCFLLIHDSFADDGTCVKSPLGTKTAPLAPDDRFEINVDQIIDGKYIPTYEYNVRLYAKDGVSTFIAFTISIREDTKPNEKNPRRPIALEPGMLLPRSDSTDAISSPQCNNTVIQSNITPKTSVSVTWIAPPKENKCVTIYALVAVKPGVWYNYEGPLSKRVCEDRRKADDMPPTVNNNCQVCEDARYQMTFKGMWSRNTHPQMYPTTENVARFSDVVGASHGSGFHVWKLNGETTEGLQLLAEQGNTTQLEIEIQGALGQDVRTIIKATGQPKPSMSTSALFRVTKDQHFVSLVTAIQPSPDWFLGVADLELCEVTSGPPKWSKSVRLNLYPMDAGTDSGVGFESPNENTSPPKPISAAVINKGIPKEKTKPFAMLHFQLIRTYATAACANRTETYSNGDKEDETPSSYGQYDNNNNKNYVTETPMSSEVPPPPDPESTADCPMTAWEEWLPCEGNCEDGTLTGYQIRMRYHLVDGVVVGKYVNGKIQAGDVKIPQECLDSNADSDTRNCEEPCTPDVSIAQRQRSRTSLLPGETW